MAPRITEGRRRGATNIEPRRRRKRGMARALPKGMLGPFPFDPFPFRHPRVTNSSSAGLTQLVECQLPKLDVAGSNPVSRSARPREGPSSFCPFVVRPLRQFSSIRSFPSSRATSSLSIFVGFEGTVTSGKATVRPTPR